MKILKALAVLILATPAFALQGYKLGPQISTTTGEALEAIAGEFYVAAGSQTLSTPTITLNGADGSVTAIEYYGDGSNLTGITSGVCLAGTGTDSVVCNGEINVAIGSAAVASGGSANVSSGTASFIGSGDTNEIDDNFGVIGGGQYNDIYQNGPYSFIGGGQEHSVFGSFSAVAGGYSNVIGDGANYSAIAGGDSNEMDGGNDHSFIGGGRVNYCGAAYCTIGGGESDFITNSASFSFVGGGTDNEVNTGIYGTIPGGYHNKVYGNYSFAAGQQTEADHQGVFIWGDSQNSTYIDNGADTFNVRAQGGAFFTSSATASSFFGDGSNLTGIATPGGNVAFKQSTQTFTGADTFTSSVSVTGDFTANYISTQSVFNSGTRPNSTVFHNTGSKLLWVAIGFTNNGTGGQVSVYCDSGTTPSVPVGKISFGGTVTFPVLPGSYYRTDGSWGSGNSQVGSWVEFH